MTHGQAWQARPLPDDSAAQARAIEVLAAAFRDDPIARHVDGDAVRRADAATAIFTTLIADRAGPVSREVIGDPIVGVAVWLRPALTGHDEAEVDLWQSLELADSGQLSRFREAIGALDAAHAAVFTDPHWYLLFVGTDAAARGRGIGSALVRAHDADADAAGLDLGLETFGDALPRFYEGLGWRVVTTTTPDFATEPLHTMRRRPLR